METCRGVFSEGLYGQQPQRGKTVKTMMVQSGQYISGVVMGRYEWNQSGQYLSSVVMGRYKWYQSRPPIVQERKRLLWEQDGVQPQEDKTLTPRGKTRTSYRHVGGGFFFRSAARGFLYIAILGMKSAT
ncbi:hypothetical protein ACLOJK_023219 [Asimina triloba]